MDPELVDKYSSSLERISWGLVFFGMLTQISARISFPSYNIAFGFWGAYCSFSKQGRATFGLIFFSVISLALDIAFCAVNGSESATFQFSLVMFIICMFIKCLIIYFGSHFFAAIGGAYSMETSMSGSQFTGLGASSGGGYYPPNSDGARE